MQHLITMLELPYDYSELVDQAAEALKNQKRQFQVALRQSLRVGVRC